MEIFNKKIVLEDGEEYLVGYSKEKGYKNYDGLGWTILVRQPLNIAYEPLDNLTNFIMLIGYIIAPIFALLGWIVAGAISKPLKNIVIASEKLKSDKSVEIPEYKGIKDIELLIYSISWVLFLF